MNSFWTENEGSDFQKDKLLWWEQNKTIFMRLYKI